MSITRCLAVQLASFALSLTCTAGPVFAQSTHVLVPADKVQWGPAPPVLPAGAQIAVLEGNPSEKGPVTLRLRFPANYNIPAHWHTMTERVTVDGRLRVRALGRRGDAFVLGVSLAGVDRLELEALGQTVPPPADLEQHEALAEVLPTGEVQAISFAPETPALRVVFLS